MTAVRPGDVVGVGTRASVQFAGGRGFVFRVIRVDDRPTYDGWVWLDGYQLDARGDAQQRRTIFVRRAGLDPIPAAGTVAPADDRQRSATGSGGRHG